MKKSILFLIVVISLSFVIAADEELIYSLDKSIYGISENFEGEIELEYEDKVSVGEKFTGEVSGCSLYSKQISLFDLYENAGMADFEEKAYDVGASKSSVSETFDGSNKKLFAFYLQDRYINNVTFKVSGSGGPLFLDIGNDGVYDWKYLGDFLSWGAKEYSEEYRAGCNPGGSYEVVGPGIEEVIALRFDEFQKESDININAVARKTGEGTLRARVGSDVCVLNNVGNVWTDVSCSMKKSVYNGSNEFEVHFVVDTNNFQAPTCAGTEHYFISLQRAVYQENLPSSPRLVSSAGLAQVVRDYIDDNCDNDWCVIPVAMKMTGSGSATLSDLNIVYAGGASLEFYDLVETFNKIDVEGDKVSLKFFEDLKTPSSYANNCSLKISFLDDSYSVNFSVSEVPKAVIVNNVDYVLKKVEIEFNGTNSTAPNNGSIVKWMWDFGDNSTKNGSVVKHTYTEDGDYIVKLKVIDENGLEGSTEKVIHIIDLEDYLYDEFIRQMDRLSESIESLKGISGDAKEFYDGMDYDLLVGGANDSIKDLMDEFEDLNGNESNLSEEGKNVLLNDIAKRLSELVDSVPKKIDFEDSLEIENSMISLPSNIPDYSQVFLNDAKREALYKFNQQNVDVSLKADLFEVEFLSGEIESFMYVDKSVSVSGGVNNVLIEDFRGFSFEDVFIFSEGYNLDNITGVIFFDSVRDIKYAVKTNELVEIKSVVFSDVSVDGDIIIDDEEEEFPWTLYIILGAVLLLGIIYINFYKGPGNFMQITNSVSYGLFHKKLFVTERDKIILKEFVRNAQARRFGEKEITDSLLAKGWTKKQIKLVFKGKV